MQELVYAESLEDHLSDGCVESLMPAGGRQVCICDGSSQTAPVLMLWPLRLKCMTPEADSALVLLLGCPGQAMAASDRGCCLQGLVEY